MSNDITSKPEKSPPTSRPRCGTEAGYVAHRRANEYICEGCQDAHHLYGQNGLYNQPPAPFDPCGTPGAYKRHRKNGEAACAACTMAYALQGRASRFHIGVEAVVAIFNQFDSLCWACKINEATRIDHDHDCCAGGSCGDCVRGALCFPCNNAEANLAHWPEARISVFADYLSLGVLAQQIIGSFSRSNEPPSWPILLSSLPASLILTEPSKPRTEKWANRRG